jgi:hypothetical protein
MMLDDADWITAHGGLPRLAQLGLSLSELSLKAGRTTLLSAIHKSGIPNRLPESACGRVAEFCELTSSH